MHYRIMVTRNEKHYFSIETEPKPTGQDTVHNIYWDVRSRFSKEEGFSVFLFEVYKSSVPINMG